jgi:predicted NBD/HSP70 family sugar kinase
MPMMFGGIDLGGTKVEACLFDADLKPVRSRRVATPRSSYAELVDCLVGQYEWLRDAAAGADLALGVGLPGVTEAATGLCLAANLVAAGKPLRQDLSRRLGFAVPFENDCKCFAFSEANGGAGEGYGTVFGLILGTGCGGGVCRRGRLVLGRNGLPGEVGHIGIPLGTAVSLDLPLLHCACGRDGCYETLLSGPGMAALARHRTGRAVPAEAIAEQAEAGDADLQRVLDGWLHLACELLRTIQVTVDPDCIVLGGGLSRIKGLEAKLSRQFVVHQVQGLVSPAILPARYGDSSGVRGAAMLAVSRVRDVAGANDRIRQA